MLGEHGSDSRYTLQRGPGGTTQIVIRSSIVLGYVRICLEEGLYFDCDTIPAKR